MVVWHQSTKMGLLKIYGKVNLMKISPAKGFARWVLSDFPGGKS
jgi:hypothetical protein